MWWMLVGVLVAGRGTVSIVVERTILPGIGDALLEEESVISVERLGISRSSVVRSSRDWRNTSTL